MPMHALDHIWSAPLGATPEDGDHRLNGENVHDGRSSGNLRTNSPSDEEDESAEGERPSDEHEGAPPPNRLSQREEDAERTGQQ